MHCNILVYNIGIVHNECSGIVDVVVLWMLSGSGSVHGIQGIDALIRMQVKQGLAELPIPQHEIEISLPEDEEMMIDEGSTAPHLEEDAEEIERRKEEQEKRRRELERQKQSQVIQQQLPRPLFPEKVQFVSSNYDQLKSQGSVSLNQAEEMLHNEMVRRQ